MNLKDKITQIKGSVTIKLTNVKTGKVTEETFRNLVTDVGKAAIASALIGTADVGVITYCALGTDATAPDPANTVLGTELARKAISVRSVASNVATFTTFYTTAEGNGSLKEAGLFGGDATAVADSGTLFCHAAINRTKTSSDTLTATWTISVG